MPLKPDLNVRAAVANVDALTAMTDQSVYKHFLSLCGRSTIRVIPPTVKWNRYNVARSPGRVSVSLYKGEQETFRISFVPRPAAST